MDLLWSKGVSVCIMTRSEAAGKANYTVVSIKKGKQ